MSTANLQLNQLGITPTDPVSILKNIPSFIGTFGDYGVVDGSSTTTIVDGRKDWATSIWVGAIVIIMTGNGTGQARVVTANTKNTLTFNAMTSAPESGALYKIFSGIYAGNLETENSGSMAAYALAVHVAQTDGGSPTKLRTTRIQDAQTVPTSRDSLEVAAIGFGITDTVTQSPQRFPNIFKTSHSTSLADNTVWTPTTGKKFRLMGGVITIAGTLAAAGILLGALQDGIDGTEIFAFAAEQPSAVATGETVVIPFNFGPLGFLSATANNVLNLDLGTAMATGEVTMNVWGTEE